MTLLDEHESAENGAQIASEVHANDIIQSVIVLLPSIDFEAKKDFVTVFCNLLRRQVNGKEPTVEYIQSKPQILDNLIKGFESSEVALFCGTMLRECTRHESLTKMIIDSPNVWKFFEFVEVANFDIASDAFATFKELLTKHKTFVAEFLEKHYERFFQQYTALLNSENYVTRRQSLKLLGELLLDRANFTIMSKYIGEPANLKLMMMLLRDKSRNIQFEAFHVFKVFVANPNKPQPVLHILSKNKEKLILFLTNFHNDKEDDQFNDEKAFLLKQIQALPANA